MNKKTILNDFFKRLACACILLFVIVNQQVNSQSVKNISKQPSVTFEQKPGELMISIGGKPFASYVYEDEKISRPYFAHVKSSCGDPGNTQLPAPARRSQRPRNVSSGNLA